MQTSLLKCIFLCHILEIPAKNLDEAGFLIIGRIGRHYWSAVVTYRQNRVSSQLTRFFQKGRLWARTKISGERAEAMLWLNPLDNQGVRFLIDEAKANTAREDRENE